MAVGYRKISIKACTRSTYTVLLSCIRNKVKGDRKGKSRSSSGNDFMA